jgi:hypothetical protein
MDLVKNGVYLATPQSHVGGVIRITGENLQPSYSLTRTQMAEVKSGFSMRESRLWSAIPVLPGRAAFRSSTPERHLDRIFLVVWRLRGMDGA